MNNFAFNFKAKQFIILFVDVKVKIKCALLCVPSIGLGIIVMPSAGEIQLSGAIFLLPETHKRTLNKIELVS